MQIQVIRTDEEHRAALAQIEALWGARDGTDDGDRLEALVALVESYETRRWPLAVDPSFDPVDVLRFAIEELGRTRAELAEILGSRSRASEILARRRALTVQMIHDISQAMEASGRASRAALRDRNRGLTVAACRSDRRPRGRQNR